ncbi:UDP-N-acetylglucosamine 4-epimerase [Gluconacetobacter johannae DSM 13595]|uniref:NAD-dependent epimerase/dehydratase family protein n=1 Tax=Gluconacetobacter johannae TaxID=112140 RepID=A0A7W4J5I4_9PROT|nr:NAD-dependent epimerase/dehydratase family protein [Gluconacetobacter johannae]MBB2175044.1 NAD-dependent epimerase/dehydratase family protein [Gluconacetobacter johannae]GBQ87204.1 UDP-N-acetylglucosamine 4-epimerase [Gluconacetobacter johannae DSM 13595]
MRILMTGTAGFIGFHLALRLLDEGHDVTGIDGMTPYYDVALKQARHARLRARPGFTCHEFMLEESRALARTCRAAQPDIVIHLAAQAGVRYSLENPSAYVSANVVGTHNLLEQVKDLPVRHFILASTSSVYGASPEIPFSEDLPCNQPLSLYAATKKACEDIGHSYAHLHGLPITACRFFTVYGPWGRPDMALFRFTRNILAGLPIDVYNGGDMERDFTYVDDLVEAVCRLLPLPPAPASQAGHGASPVAPYRVVNVGGGRPVGLRDFIVAIERATGREAIRNMLPMQPGDVPRSWADCGVLERLTGFHPATPLQAGVDAFVAWYRQWYRSADGA